jgi:hypothetical protein
MAIVQPWIFWNDVKKIKYSLLALIEVEILVARGSGNKIETQSRNYISKNA